MHKREFLFENENHKMGKERLLRAANHSNITRGDLRRNRKTADKNLGNKNGMKNNCTHTSCDKLRKLLMWSPSQSYKWETTKEKLCKRKTDHRRKYLSDIPPSQIWRKIILMSAYVCVCVCVGGACINRNSCVVIKKCLIFLAFSILWHLRSNTMNIIPPSRYSQERGPTESRWST